MSEETQYHIIYENGHDFWPSYALLNRTSIGGYLCKTCGIMRRADGQNKPCRGKVRIELRGKE